MKKTISRRFLSMLTVMAALAVFASPAKGADGAGVFLAEYVQALYDQESAIPVNQVKSILQTSDGYMWFAGYQGLMRYDGIGTKIFAPEDGFPTYNVNVLFEDRSGALWIGSNDAGLFLYGDGGFTAFGIAEGLPSASVRDIAQDSEGNLIVSTTGGVAVVSPEMSLYAHADLTGVFVTDVINVGEDSLLCLTNDGELIRFNADRIERTFDKGFLGEGFPISLFTSESGDIYVGTNGSAAYIADREFQSYKVVRIPQLQTINDFFEDDEGRIWVAADNGMGYLRDGTFYAVEGLLMSNSLECVYQDYEGSYWVASSRQGLLQLKHSRFTNINFAAQLPDYTVNTTAIFGGNLYIGADEGLVALSLPDLSIVQNELTETLSDVRVRCIIVDSAGAAWVCTYGENGLVKYGADGTLRNFTERDGLAGDQVRCVIESSKGGVIVGTTSGVSVVRGDTVVKSYTRADGVLNDVVLSLLEGADGTIYAGSDGGGVYAITENGVVNYSEKDGLSAGVILRMAQIGEGIFISTGNAVCYMDDSGIRTLDKLTAYDDSVFDILGIDDEIWFLQSNGVHYAKLENILSDDELTITQLLKRDGLSAPITANSWHALEPEGVLYIGTGKGVLSVDVRHSQKSETRPVAAVSQIRVDGVPMAPSDGMTITADSQRLELSVSLLSYVTSQGTISYMLEGFDSEFKTAKRGELVSVGYTNLKGGDYTFRLYGTNADGVRSEETSLAIRKEYAPLEMPFIQGILALLAVCIVAYAVRVFIQRGTKAADRQKQEYRAMLEQIISMIARMADSKNEFTAGHSRKVAAYSVLVGKRMGFSDEELEKLKYSALLHDIGNVCIPDSVLNKRPPLTNEEYEIIKSHASIGGDLLSSITVLEDVAQGARYHHERVDGGGYCEGLKGDEIPLPVKIICVCNAFDSMTSNRPHKRALTVDQARAELILNAGAQFDENVTAVLISLIEEGEILLEA